MNVHFRSRQVAQAIVRETQHGVSSSSYNEEIVSVPFRDMFQPSFTRNGHQLTKRAFNIGVNPCMERLFETACFEGIEYLRLESLLYTETLGEMLR